MRVTLIRKTYVKGTFQGLYHTVGNVGVQPKQSECSKKTTLTTLFQRIQIRYFDWFLQIIKVFTETFSAVKFWLKVTYEIPDHCAELFQNQA